MTRTGLAEVEDPVLGWGVAIREEPETVTRHVWGEVKGQCVRSRHKQGAPLNGPHYLKLVSGLLF